MKPTRTVRFVAAALVALSLTTTSVATASADNRVRAVNKTDHSYLPKDGFKITRVPGKTVDQSNVAYAFSCCERCKTIALAVQVLLAFDDPNNVSPVNRATAINYECSSCQTGAWAYQFTMTTDGPVNFSEAGDAKIEEIRDDIDSLLASNPSFDQVQSELDQLMVELEGCSRE